MLPDMQHDEPPARQRKRKNHIEEWRLFRGLKPGDILRATGAGKDLAWKWRSQDNFPTEEYLASLLELLQTERECLFSPPPGGPGEGKDGQFYSAPPVDAESRNASLMAMLDEMTIDELREFLASAQERLKSAGLSETSNQDHAPAIDVKSK